MARSFFYRGHLGQSSQHLCPGDIHSMKHWKLSKMQTPESPPVIFKRNHVPGLDGRKPQDRINVKYWEIIADKLSKAGWSWGCVSAIDSNGRTIWIADTHRDDGKRFVVHAEEKVTAFLELQRVTRESLRFCSVQPTPRRRSGKGGFLKRSA
jgi:hypothetical protein